MGEIRKFEEAHLPDVAALELRVFHKRKAPPGLRLQKYFGEIFLWNPWREDDLPSLVYIHNNKVAGFLGVIPRPMLFRGRPIRAAVVSQFMVDREEYRGNAGLELIRRFFAGPQDLSLTDGATDAGHAVWTAAGARAAQLYSLQWTRILRPIGYARGLLEAHPRMLGAVRTAARWSAPGCALADSVLSRMSFRALSPPRTDFRGRSATPDELFECAREIGWREPLKPSYDPESFRWLIAQAAAARRHGVLRSAVVHDPRGSRAGWYSYYAQRGGMSTVLQIGASGRHFDEVLEAMLSDAWASGSTAVSGQVVPRFLLNLANRRCLLKYIGNGVLAHTRDEDLMGCILQGEAALTRLDGEWWTRFAVEDWD